VSKHEWTAADWRPEVARTKCFPKPWFPGRFRPTRAYLAAAVLLAAFSGAGRVSAAAPASLSGAVDDMIARAAAASPEGFSGRIAIVALTMPGLDPAGVQALSRLVAMRAESRGSVSVESEAGLAGRLESVYMDPQDMKDTARRRAFYATPMAAELDWFVIIGGVALSSSLHIQLDFERVHGGWAPFSASSDLTKDRAILAFLGLPVPRNLAVKAPSGTAISVDGHGIGTCHGDAVTIPLAPGNHNVSANLFGYATYFAAIEMPGTHDLSIELKTRDCTAVPLYSTLYGALVPGLSIAMYGSPELPDGTYKHGSSTAAYIGAFVFYAGMTTWAIDKLASNEQLTLESRDRQQKIHTIELAVGLAGYALNVIGSYAIGVDFAKDNRSLVQAKSSLTDDQAMAPGGSEATLGFAMASTPNGLAPLFGYSGRF